MNSFVVLTGGWLPVMLLARSSKTAPEGSIDICWARVSLLFRDSYYRSASLSFKDLFASMTSWYSSSSCYFFSSSACFCASTFWVRLWKIWSMMLLLCKSDLKSLAVSSLTTGSEGTYSLPKLWSAISPSIEFWLRLSMNWAPPPVARLIEKGLGLRLLA